MPRLSRDILIFASIGLFIGVLPALLVSGSYATIRVGGDLTQIDPFTIFRFITAYGVLTEPVKTALVIAPGILCAFTLGGAILGAKPPLTSHGSARWASQSELQAFDLVAKPDQIVGDGNARGMVFARFGPPQSRADFFSYRDPASEPKGSRRARKTDTPDISHCLLSAPSGAGKGVGPITSSLLTFNGSVICLDMKGDNYRNTARRRAAMGDRVFKFAPYDPEGRTHRFNPLDEVVKARSDFRFVEAHRLATSILVGKNPTNSGFLGGARDIFAATALVVIEQWERRSEAFEGANAPAPPTIGDIKDLLSQGGKTNEVMQRLARAASAPEARKVFNDMAGLEHKILSSYMSILNEDGLSLWINPAVRRATSRSDFSIQDLRRSPSSIYIVVPLNDIDALAPLVRLMFQQIIAVMQRAEPGPDEPFPVLIMLDEFASLGRMEGLRSAISTLRSYHARVMLVVQSIASIRGIYGNEGADVFLSNCRIQLFMAPADSDTAKYISEAIGDRTVKIRSKSWNPFSWGKGQVSEREQGARLMRPEELRRLGGGQMIALIPESYPLKIHKLIYYKDRYLRPLFVGQTGAYPDPPKPDNKDVRTGPGGSAPSSKNTAQISQPDRSRSGPGMAQRAFDLYDDVPVGKPAQLPLPLNPVLVESSPDRAENTASARQGGAPRQTEQKGGRKGDDQGAQEVRSSGDDTPLQGREKASGQIRDVVRISGQRKQAGLQRINQDAGALLGSLRDVRSELKKE